jgi:hypothetical protein
MKLSSARTQVSTLMWLALLLPGGAAATSGTNSPNPCGPGAHVLDNCGAGVNYVEGHLTIGIDTTLYGIADFDGLFVGYVCLVRSAALDDSVNFPGTRPGMGTTVWWIWR